MSTQFLRWKYIEIHSIWCLVDVTYMVYLMYGVYVERGIFI